MIALRFLLGIGTAFALSSIAFAQDEAKPQAAIPANGTEILRALLKFQKLVPQQNFDPFDPAPSELFVVLIGSRNDRMQVFTQNVLRNDGAVFIATNENIELGNFFPKINNLNRTATVTGRDVECTRPRRCFRGDANSPFATILPPPVPELAALIKTSRVVAHRPSVLLRDVANNPYLSHTLAEFPGNSRYRGGAELEDGAAIAAMSDPAEIGKAVVVANVGMFSNQMTIANEAVRADGGDTGTDNFVFSYFLTSYLATKRDGTKRTRVLFVENGKVVTDFDRVKLDAGIPFPGGIPPIPMPRRDKLLEMIENKLNDGIEKLQDEGLPEAIVTRDRSGKLFSNIIEFATVILGIGLLGFLMRRMWGSRMKADFVPSPKIELDGSGPLVLRKRSALDTGNIREPLRDHLRVLFQQWGLPADGEPTELPPIRTDQPRGGKAKLLRALNELWAIAYGEEAVAIAPSRWRGLQDAVVYVAREAEAGSWKFLPNGSDA